MKKQLLLHGAVLAASLIMFGCKTTESVAKSGGVSPDVSASADENNVSVSARKTRIVDWQDRTIGAKVNPEWLLSIVRGNGNLYVQMYGISDEYASHKWFCSAAQDRSLANAQTIAETEVLYALASEMANTVNATVGQTLTDGQKDAIRTVCSKVNNVKLTGIGNRGSYWQLERTTDEYGNTANMYNYYALYSCSRTNYNNLLNIYMVELLKSKELDKATVNAIAGNAQQILNDAASQSEKEEKAKEREYKAQLLHEQNELFLAREETIRSQSASAAEAAKNMSPGSSIVMDAAESAVGAMSPALAAIIGAM